MTNLTPEIIAALAAPFAIEQVEVKPAAVREDGSAALALPYADWRVYANRLDEVVGPANWSIQLIPWGETRIIARLTICGITKDASGEGGTSGDENCGTSAEAQAKKRACAEFGVGRYLYSLPQVWGNGKGNRKAFRFDNPKGIVEQMYREAGLLVVAAKPRSTTPASYTPPVQAAQPDPDRLATARQVLAQAEQRSQAPQAAPATSGGALATDAQRRGIIARVLRCSEFNVDPEGVDRAGDFVGITELSRYRRAERLPELTKTQASTLITELQSLIAEMQEVEA
jgi:hypothetical protein